MSTALVWFRRDLRLTDNPALAAAVRAHDTVLPVYIHAPDEEAPWVPGAASHWWLHHALAALDADLRRRGARLHLERGPSQRTLQALLKTTGATAVYWNRCYEPAVIARDTAIKRALRDAGIEVHASNASLLAEPWEVMTGQGGFYRVFTPYWRNLRAQIQPRPPTAPPRRIAPPDVAPGLELHDLHLLPRIDWAAGMRAAWTPGERGAQAALKRFIDGALGDYVDGRNRPDRESTSRLSPHLHFGEISPRQIHWALHNHAADADAGDAAGIEGYLRELGWRDFSYHLLYHVPRSAQENLNPAFDRFPWVEPDADVLARWQHGRTGVPIVDAGMRQLWRTGWMHNRVRMVVASFLTKNLGVHWLHGARWFWDTLVDADLANNTQGWQWTAGCGADAAPYFRIFNPVSQGERFDPDGSYVRTWVEELAQVDARRIHAPWTDPALLKRLNYPQPIVDLKATREAALAAYELMRTG